MLGVIELSYRVPRYGIILDAYLQRLERPYALVHCHCMRRSLLMSPRADRGEPGGGRARAEIAKTETQLDAGTSGIWSKR
jgi:hypothetical protein